MITPGNAHIQVRGGTLMGVAPGQTGGISDNGEIIHIKGWVLLFHPDLKSTHRRQRIGLYPPFFDGTCKSLLQDGHTVSETAEAIGFDYPQHFTRVFKKHFGVAPSSCIQKR